MVEIHVRYEGQLHCTATHVPSGSSLQTDAPPDNMGKGESFSPTDLLATSLGTCMMTIMAIAAQKHQVDLTGSRVIVTKEMVNVPLRRVGRLGVTIIVPIDPGEDRKTALENAAKACPVHRSLHPDVATPVRFEWGKS